MEGPETRMKEVALTPAGSRWNKDRSWETCAGTAAGFPIHPRACCLESDGVHTTV